MCYQVTLRVVSWQQPESSRQCTDNILTRFNKTAIHDKGPDGKWTRKPLAYRESNIFHLYVICTPEIFDSITFCYSNTNTHIMIYIYVHILIHNRSQNNVKKTSETQKHTYVHKVSTLFLNIIVYAASS